MTAPRRWTDSPEAPEDVKELFAAGRPTRGMSRETRARLGHRLARPLAAAVVTSYVLAWKSVAVAAVIGLTATTAVVVAVRAARAPDVVVDAPPTGAPVEHAPAAGTSRAAMPASPTTPPPSALPPEPLAPLPVPSTTTAAPRNRIAPSPPPPAPEETAPPPPVAEDTLAPELALLDQARASYASDPQAALDRLDEHARRFPGGKLSLERELLALDALKRLGRTADERARAARLLSVVRGTIYEARVRTHLGEEP
jgi:hypothetical protein